MAKDQQANQSQLMGANAPQQTPSYNPQMGAQANQNAQMGAQSNFNAQMGAQPNFNAMNAGYRPQQFGLTPQAGMAPTGGPRPFKGNVQGGGPTNAPPPSPASSNPRFQEALGRYFKQNPGAFTKHMNASYRPVSGRQNPNPFMPEPPMSTGTPPLSLRDQMMTSSPYPGGQAADPRNAGGPRGPRPKYHGGQGAETRNRSRGLASGIRGRASGRNDLNSGSMLQGPSSFAPNSPYSNRNR